jgi:hypothetical protein
VDARVPAVRMSLGGSGQNPSRAPSASAWPPTLAGVLVHIRQYLPHPRGRLAQQQRLQRGLLCTPLTSGNEFPHTMIGGLSRAGGLRIALVLVGRADLSAHDAPAPARFPTMHTSVHRRPPPSVACANACPETTGERCWTGVNTGIRRFGLGPNFTAIRPQPSMVLASGGYGCTSTSPVRARASRSRRPQRGSYLSRRRKAP